MAQDGSQPWQGAGAFPFLLHHPSSDQQKAPVATYRDVKVERGNTGTWDGPAPSGAVDEDVEKQSSERLQARAQQDYVLLPGGAHLPLIGFGTYKVTSEDTIKQALAAGYRHFDCAAKYSNEDMVGRALKGFIASESGRSKLFITSKIWNDCHRPKELRDSAIKTISQLDCQYLDLLLIHWPEAFLPGTNDKDSEVTIEQTCCTCNDGAQSEFQALNRQTMEELVQEGKVKYLGVSNFSLGQIDLVLQIAKVKPVVNQIELHPLLAQRKLVGTCLRKGITCVAFSPLGHGKDVLFDIPEVKDVAAEVQRTPAQVLLRYNVQRGVPVIPRSQTEKNIQANISGLFEWNLTGAQKAKLDALDRGHRTVNEEWHVWDKPCF